MILDNKTVLVTGGTGSLGKALVKRLLSNEMGTLKKVIVVSRDEAKQHDMRMAYLNRTVTTEEVIYRNFQRSLEFRIGDIRNYHDVCFALKNADVVINAAALKQVPTCEYFPDQAILTNCIGAMNIVRAIRENDFNIDTMVGISTDKACKPINVMGMSKAMQERIFISANILAPQTRFICVRYGNVLASRGSVVPLFRDQIARGGPVTVTVPEMTRFLLSLDEAVSTIFAALEDGKPGETFVPTVPASTLLNIATALIGDRDVKIENIGARPGDKMHEILISREESPFTIKKGRYYAIQSMLPELYDENMKEPMSFDQLSSKDHLMSFEETRKMFSDHGLLDIDDAV